MLKFNHVGIPTNKKRKNEVYIETSKVYLSMDKSSPYKIEWLRFEKDSPMPKLIQEVAHPCYEVDDIHEATKDKKVILEPTHVGGNMTIAFIEVDGAPVEFLKINK
jgi:hypothetical protein